MPLQALKVPPFKAPKEATISWETWRKGLNLLLRETEIDKAEAVQSTNLVLVGSGVPTKRWGSQNYFLSGATGYGLGLIPVKNPDDDTIEVLALTDWGILTKKSNASYAVITGASFGSGYKLEGTQLGGKVYLVNGQRELVKYNFSTLAGFPTLAIPTGLSVSNLSGASGLRTVSWRVTSISNVGETLASTPFSLASLPASISGKSFLVKWTAVSAASGDLSGYNIYRGSLGNEQWVGGVDSNTTSFLDGGQPSVDPFRTAPLADTTGGLIAKYIIRYQDRLIYAGIDGSPTKVVISGRYPLHERIDWQSGGGDIQIEPDSGETITGLGVYYNSQSSSQTIIVFKEKSVWEISLGQTTFGDFVILSPTYRLLTASQGCSSHRSIAYVENDVMFANRKGIYILRYEPQLINVINANEISAKIRPFFEGLTDQDHQNSSAVYADKKYLISYPSSKRTVVFDRERLSFIGPWVTPYGINKWGNYIDENGIERWICTDATDSYVSEFRKTLTDDKGTAFNTIFRTKKEDFGDWTLFKVINEVYTLFRNVVGSVNANIFLEERSGQTITAKSFSLTSATGTSGFGTDEFGLTQFGISGNDATFASNETPKKSYVYKIARTFQLEILTNGKPDNYELLGVKVVAFPQGRGNSPSAWVV